jgi:predicted N-formylglutamate amidohydrolase
MIARVPALVLSCEHGGNRVPRAYAPLFAGAGRVLASHRGWDKGALALARVLAKRTSAPLFAAETTRLLVDLNRADDNPAVFSRFTRELPDELRDALIEDWHRPHRQRVIAAIERLVARRRSVLHVAVHSFTPVMNGVVRNADIGLLYDPGRVRERGIARAWKAALREATPSLRVRSNYPYGGVSDGLTRALRRRVVDRDYAGIELEVNQRLVGDRRRFAGLCDAIAASLLQVVSPPRTADRSS